MSAIFWFLFGYSPAAPFRKNVSDVNTKSLGDMFRAERVRQGLDLARISAETKISRHILQAIEDDKFESIPGGSYQHIFLRQYAHVLRLDEEEIVNSFRHQYEVQPQPPQPLPEMSQKVESRFASWLWALVLLLALFGLYRVSKDDRTDKVGDRAAVTPVKPLDLPGERRSAVTKNDILPAVSVVHVQLTAMEAVWVSVECDGALSYTGTLTGSESKVFEASRVVRVLAGNAGGLIVSLNGRPVGPLGAHGEVQLFELSPDGPRRIPRHSTQPIESAATPRAF